MASLKQLADKIKTFQDFSKVVNIQKIVVMKEIAEQKKIIKQLDFRDMLFSNLIIDLHKKHGAFDKSFFSSKKPRVPFIRDLHFIMSSSTHGSVGEYSNKLIIDFIKKNHKPEDIYVVVGKNLGDMLKKKKYNVINVMMDASMETNDTYERIAAQVLRGYRDLMFVRSTFSFFDMASKQITEMKLFPFAKEKREFDKTNMTEFAIENVVVEDMKLSKITWLRDLDLVSQKIAQFAIREKSFYIMTKYRLSAKLRELQALDDKEKNILEEITMVKLKMQRVRQESVTNELLTNAVAFGALNALEEEDE